MTASTKRVRVSIISPTFALWERRKVEALRATGAKKAEMIAALEHYREIMKKREGFVLTAFKEENVSRTEIYDAQYQRLEAEMWLNQEKTR